MKCLTVRQPWAWAIVAGGKDVENRSQLWSHRGPLAIHAAMSVDQRGLTVVPQLSTSPRWPDGHPGSPRMHTGAVIGAVDLVGAHESGPGCCTSPWAQPDSPVHLELANARAFGATIPCRGALGLWTPPDDVIDRIDRELARLTKEPA